VTGNPLQPSTLVHRHDETNDALHLIEVDRATRQRLPFLVDAELGERATTIAPRAEIVAGAPDPAPLHFLFHSAFCCSTLLANALDVAGVASTLKEPQLLADMTGWRLRGGEPRRIQTVLDQALTLLARPFEPGEAVIVKPSNVVNGLAEAMLTMRPQACAILMYAPLPAFLASIARKSMDGRLWARELLSKQLAEGMIDLGFTPRDYLRHTDLQAAAVSWLAQKALFARIAARWPDRIRTLDSEVFVARPADTIAAAVALFDLSLERDTVTAIVADRFTRNAKNGAPFASDQRLRDREAGSQPHADEIAKVSIWAEAVAQAAGLPTDWPSPLLG
jgi:hypothetical protein